MRKKGIIAVISFIVIFLVIGLFFTDDIIETSIEKAGTYIWGARVDVGNVRVGWSPLNVELINLDIASRQHEYKNRVSIGNIGFSVIL
jgi:hypothetical protein